MAGARSPGAAAAVVAELFVEDTALLRCAGITGLVQQDARGMPGTKLVAACPARSWCGRVIRLGWIMTESILRQAPAALGLSFGLIRRPQA